eukprot:scaffold288768_cov22-Tisochrysis_lutea.AAC.1
MGVEGRGNIARPPILSLSLSRVIAALQHVSPFSRGENALKMWRNRSGASRARVESPSAAQRGVGALQVPESARFVWVLIAPPLMEMIRMALRWLASRSSPEALKEIARDEGRAR